MPDFPFGEPPFDIGAVRELCRPCYGTPASDVAMFQEYMIRQRRPAWWARQTFDVPATFGKDTSASTYREGPDGPVWCFTRFGRTVTQIGFGDIIYIGGEHEDFYDPDFCIYNDIVHEDANGNIEVVGFAKDEFPPTDFHTATIVRGEIWLIGSLGYMDLRREGAAQVLRLDPATMKLAAVETGGADPGWISSHEARFVRGRNEIVVWGGKVWKTRDGELRLCDHHGAAALSLDTLEWRRVGFAEASDA